ncbi:hypothetical protein XENTR_v10003716 [Xenopus tropicalis]|uniref:Olfactory receptor n=1 Tax=Xenopus tropicalis TaxID=8364 RepID=A0A8J1J0D6_XENTR|nr:olfactory receptor 1-like [Xenopus tropicalis]KAE8575112.1 hypothetical protein XENTR_v10003716 [Xenopus tropicalis]
MGNHSYFEAFHILAFSDTSVNHLLMFFVFFVIYSTTVVGNVIIISLVLADSRLHTPMYILLSNLSSLDVGFTTVTIPKLMDILLTGYHSISYRSCLTQLYFFVFFGSTEALILSSMAYDRYVAICHPLQYHAIMSGKKYALIVGGPWIMGSVNSFFLTSMASKLSFCGARNIDEFYCNFKALSKISCNSSGFQTIIYIDTFIVILFQLMLIFISYIKIITVTLGIRSSGARMKFFSTCSSHLTTLIIFYGSVLCMYARPPSQHADDLDNVFSVLHTAITPMLNPLVYSLRNNDVKSALEKIKEKLKWL